MATKNIGTAFQGGSIMGMGAPAFRGGGKGYGVNVKGKTMYFATQGRAAQAAKNLGGKVLGSPMKKSINYKTKKMRSKLNSALYKTIR